MHLTCRTISKKHGKHLLTISNRPVINMIVLSIQLSHLNKSDRLHQQWTLITRHTTAYILSTASLQTTDQAPAFMIITATARFSFVYYHLYSLMTNITLRSLSESSRRCAAFWRRAFVSRAWEDVLWEVLFFSSSRIDFFSVLIHNLIEIFAFLLVFCDFDERQIVQTHEQHLNERGHIRISQIRCFCTHRLKLLQSDAFADDEVLQFLLKCRDKLFVNGRVLQLMLSLFTKVLLMLLYHLHHAYR